MSHDNEHNGNGDDTGETHMALEEAFAEQGAQIQRFQRRQELFEAEIVARVSVAVATLLEQRLARIEARLGELEGLVRTLTAEVQAAMRRV